MSHALIKNLPETLSQPLSIATLASLGIHGLFWVILPVLPVDSQSEAAHSPRTVGLVQLTPDEQSRLPGAAAPSAALPSFGAQPNQSDDLPSLPPPPAYQAYTLPPLPPPPALSYAPLPGNTPNYPPSATLPPPGAFPVPPPPPEQTAQAPITQFSPGELPAPPAPDQSSQTSQAPTAPAANQTLKLGESLPLKPFKLPPNRSLPTTSGLKSEPFTPENPTEQVAPYTQPQIQPQQPQQQVASANPTSPPQPTANNSTRPNQLPKRGKQELLALREKARESKSDRSDTATSTTEATDQQRREQLAAQLRQQPQSQPEILPQTAEQQRREQLAAQLRQQPQSQPNSTSPQTARTIAQINDYEERLQAVQQAVPQVETKPPIRAKVKTCEQQLNGQAAVFGVVVDQAGQIISGPDFIPKNSAAAVQQAAKEYVSNYQFAKSDRPIDQSFRLEFEYSDDSCSASSKSG